MIAKNPDINELKESLEKQPDYQRNFCLLNQIIKKDENIKLIPNVISINELIEYLFKKYNNNITRTKAKIIKPLNFEESNEISKEIEKLKKPFL